MGYQQPELPSKGLLRNLSWTLLTVGGALLVFVTWHQIAMDSISKRYGIAVPWQRELLWLLAFVGLEGGALYAARRRQYGVSIGLSSFVVAMLGIASLFVVAQIGM